MNHGERAASGQILVVSALVIAVLFIGMALVLNGAIYAENTATQDTESGDRISLEQRQQIEEQFGETIDRTNANVSDENNTEVTDDLKAAIENQSDTWSEDQARRGTSVIVETNDASNGTRLRQSETSAFTPKDNSTGDWTLTEGVPAGGQFAMNIRQQDLLGATFDTTMALLADSAFGIEFVLDDDAHSLDESEFTHPIAYRIYIFSGGITDSTYAVVEHPDQEFEKGPDSLNHINRTNANHITAGWLNQSCSMQGDNVSLKLGESRFGGTHCEPFSFYSEDLGAHEVRFTNTYTWGQPRANGTYDIMVESTDYNEAAFHSYGNGDPYAQSAVYSANYTLEYNAGGTAYTIENSTVTPRERTRGGILWEHPRVEEFNVIPKNATGGNKKINWTGSDLKRTFSTTGGSEYIIDWSVADPNGELDRATVRLIERDSLEAGAEGELNKTVLNESLDVHIGNGDLKTPIEDSVNNDDPPLIEKNSIRNNLCNLLGFILGDCRDLDIADDIINDDDEFDAYVSAYLNVYGRIDSQANVDEPLNDDWTVDKQEYDLSGAEASGVDVLGPTRSNEFVDLVQIQVVNEAGHSRTETVRCEPKENTCESIG
jgi:hypothetical protein